MSVGGGGGSHDSAYIIFPNGLEERGLWLDETSLTLDSDSLEARTRLTLTTRLCPVQPDISRTPIVYIMAQIPVQTLYRDPQLLYVNAAHVS